MFDLGKIKKRSFLLLLTAATVLSLPFAAFAADDGQSFESYTGKEKILDLQTADTAYRTTEAVSKRHVIRQSDLKATSYRLENSLTHYYDGNETEILSWTDKSYVKAGDAVVTLKSTVDEVALAQYELQLKRDRESYRTQCELYELQIQNKKQTAEALSGIEQKIAEQELLKAKLEYEQYRYGHESSNETLRKQIEQMKQNRESTVIYAKAEGYLYIPNDKLTDLEDRPIVQRNEALFAVVKPGGAAFTVADAVSPGALDDANGAVSVCNADVCREFAIYGGSTLLFDADAVTEPVLQTISGVQPQGKWSVKFSFDIPVAGDAVALKTSLVHDDDGNMLYSLLASEGSFDYTKRYYVNLLRDGMEQKQYVLLGPVMEDTVIILEGVKDGDLVIM